MRKLLCEFLPLRQLLFAAFALLFLAAPSFAQDPIIIPWVGDFSAGDGLFLQNTSGDTQSVTIYTTGFNPQVVSVDPYDTLKVEHLPAGWAVVYGYEILSWAVTGQTTIGSVGLSTYMYFNGHGDDNGIALGNVYHPTVNFEIEIFLPNMDYWGHAYGYIEGGSYLARMMSEIWANLPANYTAFVTADNHISGVATDCGNGLPCTVVGGT